MAREIQLHAELNHPGIIGFYAAFETLDAIYLVEEVRVPSSPLALLYHSTRGGVGRAWACMNGTEAGLLHMAEIDIGLPGMAEIDI